MAAKETNVRGATRWLERLDKAGVGDARTLLDELKRLQDEVAHLPTNVPEGHIKLRFAIGVTATGADWSVWGTNGETDERIIRDATEQGGTFRGWGSVVVPVKATEFTGTVDPK